MNFKPLEMRMIAGMLGLLLVASAAPAQQSAPKARSGATTQTTATAMKPEELEALTAQIALYPDSVLAQVLMASTYPLEIVQADRWVKANPKLKDDALAKELEKQDWDPSVKSLVQFPQVLEMMSKQLDWTTKLGDAFIADQNAVMAAVQRLRTRAHEKGNLKDSPEQKIIIEKSDPAQVVVVESAPVPPQIIKIESPSPSVVYVPTYNPTVVYGTWPYPYYPPPAPYYPPGYVASSALWFGAGVALGAAWGHAWGNCNWGHGGDCDVDIDVDRNTNFNKNIDRDSYKQKMQNRQTDRQTNRGQGDRGQGRFQHDAAHRKGVSYRDQGTANRFGDAGAREAAKARESFRGRAESGRQDIGRGGASGFQRDLASGRTDAGRNTAAARDRSTAGGGGRDSAGGRTGSSSSFGSSSRDRSSLGGSSGSRGSAFDGAGRTSGSTARSYSDRGSSSRGSYSSGSRSRSGGSSGFSSGGSRGGGGSRSSGGGGGSRGGGGRGGGGGRR